MNILTNTQIHHNHTNIHNSMNRHIHLSIQINVPSEAYTKIVICILNPQIYTQKQTKHTHMI